jgi:hypothetical protein
LRIGGDRNIRICWTVPIERPVATINAQSQEDLDVCAVLSEDKAKNTNFPKRIAPVETGWVVPPRDLGNHEIEGQLVISAKNTNPKTFKIRVLPFEKATDRRIILVFDN